MKKLNHSISFLFVVLTQTIVVAQNKEDIEKIKQHTNVGLLKKIAAEEKAKSAKNFERYKSMPKQNFQMDTTRSKIIGIDENGEPIIASILDVESGYTHRTNHIQNGGSLGLDLEGLNMNIGVWDLGAVKSNHIEYGGRVQNDLTNSNLIHSHPTNVAGIIAAEGLKPAFKGIASKSSVTCHDMFGDINLVPIEAAAGLLVSNHSYTFGIGYNSLTDEWEVPNNNDQYFGKYRSRAQKFDAFTFNAPYYLPVFAAGNWGDQGFSLSLESNSTFDQIIDMGVAKNPLVVGNMWDLTTTDFDVDGKILSPVVIYQTSSKGPTDDYRIKPDIVGNGVNVWTTTTDVDYDNICYPCDALESDGGNCDPSNRYRKCATGTSAAAPNIAANLLLFQEYYHDLNTNFMRAATLKGLALHTADDAVAPLGPDAVYGWGVLNAKFAAETIRDANATSNQTAVIEERILDENQTHTYSVVATGDKPLQVSISWTDYPGAINTLGANDGTPALVNDLDVKVTHNGITTFHPWRLITVTTNDNGGDNDVDPYERVDILTPVAGDVYVIEVTHENLSLECDKQDYSLIITGINSYSSLTSNGVNTGNCVGIVEDDCPDDLVLTDPITGVDEEKAGMTITATNLIVQPANVIYHAGNSVTLDPGFMTEYNSVFSAYIEGCDGISGPQLTMSNNYLASVSENKIETESTQIEVYPNPTTGKFQVKSLDSPIEKIEIYTILGDRLMVLDKRNQNQIEIDLNNYQNGIYYLNCFTSNKKHTIKVVKN